MANKKRSSKKKINPYILIAIIFIVAALASLFLQRKQSIQTNNSYEVTQTPTTKTLDATSATLLPYKEPTKYSSKQAVVENGYAFIPELHIKFKVDDNLSDLTYTYFAFEDPGYQNYENKTSFARISTQRLSENYQDCSSEDGAIGNLGRSLEDPIGKLSGPLPEYIKKIGDYYYYFLHPQSSCTHPDEEGIVLESQQIKALQNTFQTIEAVQ